MKWIADTEGSLIFIEPEWQILTGQSVRDALGTGWLAKIHPADRLRAVSDHVELISKAGS